MLLLALARENNRSALRSLPTRIWPAGWIFDAKHFFLNLAPEPPGVDPSPWISPHGLYLVETSRIYDPRVAGYLVQTRACGCFWALRASPGAPSHPRWRP